LIHINLSGISNRNETYIAWPRQGEEGLERFRGGVIRIKNGCQRNQEYHKACIVVQDVSDVVNGEVRTDASVPRRELSCHTCHSEDHLSPLRG
jgi:hypothetical protein